MQPNPFFHTGQKFNGFILLLRQVRKDDRFLTTSCMLTHFQPGNRSVVD